MVLKPLGSWNIETHKVVLFGPLTYGAKESRSTSLKEYLPEMLKTPRPSDLPFLFFGGVPAWGLVYDLRPPGYSPSLLLEVALDKGSSCFHSQWRSGDLSRLTSTTRFWFSGLNASSAKQLMCQHIIRTVAHVACMEMLEVRQKASASGNVA